MQRKILSIWLTLCMILAMAPTVTFAADEGLKWSKKGVQGEQTVASGNVLEIKKPGTYRVSNAKTSEATSATIKVNTASDVTVILILDGVNIQAQGTKAAIAITGESNVIIANGSGKTNTLAGDSPEGYSGNAGIVVEAEAALTLTCENALNMDENGTVDPDNPIKENHKCTEKNCGKLEVTGGKGANGIGGNNILSNDEGNDKLMSGSINIQYTNIKVTAGSAGPDGTGHALGHSPILYEKVNDHNLVKYAPITIDSSNVELIPDTTTMPRALFHPKSNVNIYDCCVYYKTSSTEKKTKTYAYKKDESSPIFDEISPTSGYEKLYYLKTTPHSYQWTLDKSEDTVAATQKCSNCEDVGTKIDDVIGKLNPTIKGATVENLDNLYLSVLDYLTEKNLVGSIAAEGKGSTELTVKKLEGPELEKDETVKKAKSMQATHPNWKLGENFVFNFKIGVPIEALSEIETHDVTKTTNKIKITINIPTHLQGKSDYRLVGFDENGKFNEYLDQDKDPNTYTIETNMFGTYVLAYKDEAPAPEPTSTPTTKPNVPVKTTANTYPTGNNPIPSLFALLVAASSIGALASLSRKKSNKR